MIVGDIVTWLLVGQSTVSAHLYRVNPECVSCFPSAGDVVMPAGPRCR